MLDFFCKLMFAMPNIRSIDMLLLDDLIEMSGGYVLNFSDRTIAHFFAEELDINFDDPLYAKMERPRQSACAASCRLSTNLLSFGP